MTGSTPPAGGSEIRYVVLRGHEADSELPAGAVERLGTVAATTREKAHAAIALEPTAWVAGLKEGERVLLGLIPESSWPEFVPLAARARLELCEATS